MKALKIIGFCMAVLFSTVATAGTQKACLLYTSDAADDLTRAYLDSCPPVDYLTIYILAARLKAVRLNTIRE